MSARVGPHFDNSVANLEDIELMAYGVGMPGEKIFKDATAYLNQQSMRLSSGNLTDQRVSIVLAQTAATL